MAGRKIPYNASAGAARNARIAKKVVDDAARSLYLRGEGVMTRSKRDFVPVDLGALRSTGHVSLPETKGTKIRVQLSYGGPSAPYALAIHEHLSKHSPPSWRHTSVTFSPAGHGPKYLERPLLEAVPSLAREIARDIDIAKAVRESN